MIELASIILAGASAYQLFLISRGDRTGWIIGLLIQPPYAVYSAVTHQPGFVLLSLLYTWVNVKGYERHK
jgi:hypothetical protein